MSEADEKKDKRPGEDEVPGQTLAERIARGPLKLQEALLIAQQIAEAVAAAQEKGVIHGDLRPVNIKIIEEARVRVLDFGIAKAVAGEGLDQQSTGTEPGRVIGTPAYMSPERVRRKACDKRSDIWSFGCVLYEMLTGRVPFEGEAASDTLAAILEHEPDWHALPWATPPNIRVLLRRCLEKDPWRRLQHIGDAAIEISETLNLPPSMPPVTVSSVPILRSAGLRRSILRPAAWLLFGAIAATVVTWYLTRPAPMSLSCFPISLPHNQMLNEYFSDIALSPDGKRLVYVGGLGEATQLILRKIGQIKGRELPETKGAIRPFFSPDGQSIAFLAEGKLKTLFLDGGRPQPLCDAARLPGGSWCPDGTIFFTRTWEEGISRISVDGRVPKTITVPDAETGEFGHWWPEVLPGGSAVLFTIWKTTLNDACVAVLSLKTGKYQKLVTGATHARYAPTGHLLYAQSGTLVAAPFNLKKLKLGEPRPVVEGLKQSPFTGYAPFCFSQDGLLYYVHGGEWLARRRLVWVDRQGDEVELLTLPPGAYSQPRLSPDGRRVAFTKFERDAFNVWVYEFASESATQRTFESNNFLPVWTPDGTELTFTTYRRGPFSVYSMPVDRVGTEEPLVMGTYDREACSWSPDGKRLLFVETAPNTDGDIWLFSAEDANVPRALLCESWDERQAVFSPAGDWIAYVSDAEGRPETYVTPYPGPGESRKLSADGGYQPVWSRDGKELFYRSGNKMMAATIKTRPEFKVTGSKVLFEGRYLTDYHRNYDVSSDGQRFLMIKEAEGQPAATELIIVLNWFEELKRLVPAGDRRL